MKRVLIVDDHELCREAAAMVLAEAGYDVRTAADANDALERLRQQTFDLIVCDYKMPGRTGLELLRQLRNDDYWIPFVLTSASDLISVEIGAFELGAHFIAKPFRKRDLTRIAATAIESSGAFFRACQHTS